MQSSIRSGGILLRVLILVSVGALLVGGGYAAHKYRKRAAARNALATGKEAYAAKRYTDAAPELGRYLGVDPRNVDVLLMYADAQLRRRPQAGANFQQAVNALELILRAQPGQRTAAERLLDLYTAIDAKPDAERVARAWLAAAGSDSAACSAARQRLFAALTAQQKLDDAKKLVDGWLVTAPTDPVALRSSAQLLLTRQETDDAAKIRQKTADAIKALRMAVEQNPTEVEAVAQLASLLVLQEQVSPEDRQKNRAAAERSFSELLTRVPTSARARLARGKFRLLCSRLPDRSIEDFNGAIQDLDEVRKLATQDEAILMDLGSLYSELGLADKAVAVLEEAEKAAPGNLNVYDEADRLVLGAGDASIAAAFVDRALAASLGEQRLDLFPGLIELCVTADRLAQAHKLSDELRAAQPSPETMLYVEAVIDQAEGRLSDAITKLQDVVRRSPRMTRAQLLLGRLWVRTRQLQRSVGPLQAFIESTERSGGLAVAANVRLELAGIYAQLGRWDEAARTVREIEIRVPNLRLANVAGFSALEFEAQAALRSGAKPDYQRLKSLQARLDKLIEKSPNLAQLQTLKARILGWQGQPNEGAVILNGLKAEAENKQLAVEALIDLYADAGRFDQAARECAAAIELAADAGKPALRARLVELRASAGDLAAARQTLKAIEAAGPVAQWGAAKSRLAQVLLRRGQPDDARAELLELVTKDPRNIPARVNLLAIKPAKDQKPSPQELVEQIKSLEGDKGQNWRYYQANVWLASDDWVNHRDQAEKLLRESLADDAAWDAGAMALAALYEKAGEDAKALELYQTQLKQSPGSLDLARRLLTISLRLQRWAEMERVLSLFPMDETSLQGFRLELMQRTGDRQQASRTLEKQIKDNPQDYLACLQLRALKLEGNDVTEAERLLNEAVRINPQAREVLQARVQVHVRQREYELALALCDQLLAQGPSADGYQLRSQVHEAKGDLAKADQDLRAIAGLPGAAGRAYLALGRLYFRHNQRDKAIDMWREGLKAAPGFYPMQGALAGALLGDADPRQQQAGLDLLTEMLKKNPKDEALLLMRAEHLTRSKPAEAQKAYEEITSLNPNSAAAYRGLAALALAQRSFDSKDRALEFAERGLNADPHDIDLLLLRSDLLISSSPERALVSAREAAKMQPQSEQAALALANGLANTDKVDAAITCLQDFLKRADAGPRARTRLLLASLLIPKGDYTAADALIEEARRLTPDDPLVVNIRLLWHQRQQQWDIIAALASDYLQRPEGKVPVQAAAQMLVNSRQPKGQEEGLSLLQRLVERYPNDASNYAQLGAAYHSLRKPVETRAAWERAIALTPGKDPDLMNNLAWVICEDLKDPRSALEWSQKAMAAAPGDPHVLDTWGVLQFRLGNLEASREALQRCRDSTKTTEETRLSATLHLARTLMTLDPQESGRLLDKLLHDRRVQNDYEKKVFRLLSAANYEEARGLLDELSAQTKPAL